MTGTYRNMSNEIWDPHPQYNLNVFGRQLHLVLRQDASFVHNHSMTHIRILKEGEEHPGPETEAEAEQRHLGCFYSGYVEDDPHSMVSVSLCGGMVRPTTDLRSDLDFIHLHRINISQIMLINMPPNMTTNKRFAPFFTSPDWLYQNEFRRAAHSAGEPNQQR